MSDSLKLGWILVYWQVLVGKAAVVDLGAEILSVTKAKSKELRQVFFEYEGEKIMAIEQNPNI